MKSLSKSVTNFEQAVIERQAEETDLAVLKEFNAHREMIRVTQETAQHHHVKYDNDQLCRNEEYRLEMIETLLKMESEQTKNDAVYHEHKEGINANPK